MSPIPWGHGAPNVNQANGFRNAIVRLPRHSPSSHFIQQYRSSLISHSEYEALSGGKFAKCLQLSWGDTVQGCPQKQKVLVYISVFGPHWG